MSKYQLVMVTDDGEVHVCDFTVMHELDPNTGCSASDIGSAINEAINKHGLSEERVDYLTIRSMHMDNQNGEEVDCD